jgi:hypothetical protein
MYLLYIFPLSSTCLWLYCSNFFNPSKKNSLLIGNKKTQRLTSKPTYILLPTRHFAKRKALYCHCSKSESASLTRNVFSQLCTFQYCICRAESQAQSQVTSCEICGWWNGFSLNFFSLPMPVIIPLLLCTHLLPACEVCHKPWAGTTLSHPWHLGWGLCLWPGTWLVKLVDWSLVGVVVFETSCPIEPAL